MALVTEHSMRICYTVHYHKPTDSDGHPVGITKELGMDRATEKGEEEDKGETRERR